MNKILLVSLIICASFFSQAQIYQGAHTFGVGSFDLPQTSAIDAAGNIYSAGNISGGASFGTATFPFRGGNLDGYLAKYDPMGNPLWIKPLASGFDDNVIAMTISSSGDIFLTGYFQGAGTQSFDADPGPGVFTLSQPAPILSRDCFIIKLNSNGDFVWAKQISNPSGGAAQEDSYDIEVNEQGEVFVAGRFIYADFDPGPGSQTILTPSNGFEGFIVKLDANGDFLWVNHLKNSQNVVRDIDFDSNGNIVAVGEYSGTIDVSGATATAVNLTATSSSSMFMVKYDTNGNHLWSQSTGGTGTTLVNVLEKTTNDRFLIGGSFNGTIDINPDPTIAVNITSAGSSDGFVMEIATNGRLNRQFHLGASSSDAVTDINVDVPGKVLVSGTFSNVVDFDSGMTTATSTSSGGTDAFVLSVTDGSLAYETHFTYGGTANLKKTRAEFNSTLSLLSFIGGFNLTVNFDPFSGVDNKSSMGLDDIYLMQLNSSVLSNDHVNTDISINMYPNPASNFINLTAANRLESATIMDMNGRMLSQTNFTGNATEQRVSLEHLSSGIYFMTIKSEVGQKVEKLIVE
ncbi:MAG: T9SS type A sorting domain-containing protein [Nonlabens sp.]|uniref:T9SS type A sorting domain-containing protein n=1 Tax=Nonlabens sp. TaxID=1888209 RepID=UPI003EFAC682